MRDLISLNDSYWFVGAVSPQSFPAANDFAMVAGWLPASVPGDVRLDLLRLGKIPDPFLARNNEASRWVDEYDWWYRRDMELDAERDTRTFLIFEGIDYSSAVYWNDRELGRHTGMFSRQVYEIPHGEILAGENRLGVRVSGGQQLPRLKLNPAERLWRSAAGKILPQAMQAQEFPERYATLKTQMSFGWDFAPRLLTCGIWDEAWIGKTRAARICDAWVQGVPDGRVRLTIEFDTIEPLAVRAQFLVVGKNFDAPAQSFEFPFQLEKSGTQTFSIQIKDPKKWDTWDHGFPHMYHLRVSISDESGELDSYKTTFGLRTIDLEQNPDAPVDSAPWTFVLNGNVEYIRGANWVPADAIPARVTRDDYAALLDLARDANINLLRVWGGGLKEKNAFYELCDELGIMVWQEFPFSGAGIDYFPPRKEYFRLVRQECAAIVSALRNHPSVVLWCGGNEFIPRANRRLVEIMRETVANHDGSRPFKPASPSQNESHNWRVWHGLANTRDYQNDNALFFGEFGMQAAPNVETLERFLPEEGIFPPNQLWEYHNAEIAKLWRYAVPLLSVPKGEEISPAVFVAASQEAQLRGLQVAIEHARRRKGRVSGCVFWQFNEPWYSICWSVVDYRRVPKRAYAKIKEVYNPTLVSFAYPLRPRSTGELVSGQVWIINDKLTGVHGMLTASHNDQVVLSLHVEIAPNAANALATLDLMLAAGSNRLNFELRGEGLLATNEYDLCYCDDGEINRGRAFMTNAATWLRTSY